MSESPWDQRGKWPLVKIDRELSLRLALVGDTSGHNCPGVGPTRGEPGVPFCPQEQHDQGLPDVLEELSQWSTCSTKTEVISSFRRPWGL